MGAQLLSNFVTGTLRILRLFSITLMMLLQSFYLVSTTHLRIALSLNQ